MALDTFERSAPPIFRQGLSATTKLVLLALLSILLMASDHRFKISQPLRSGIAMVLAPLQWLSLQPGRAIHATAQYFSNLLQVLKPLPLDNLHCPVLALIPRGRQMTDPLITRRTLGVIKDLQLCELEADHWIPTRQPEAMCEAIDDWIEAHFSAATDHRANAT